ncbi:MAG: TSUP family transporter [Acidimicrobiales bacterium]
MTGTEALLAALIFGAGAAVQGAVGFGANLVAAPLLVHFGEGFVPGPVIVASAVLNVLLAWRSGPGDVDPTVTTAIGGQVVGSIAAGAVIAMLPADALSLVFALLVLAAVAVSVAGRRLSPTRSHLAGAGLASGFMGTISGIGGPPIALAYLGLDGPALRATLARYFLVGNLVAIPTLIVVGSLGTEDVGACLVLVPGSIGGFLVSGWLARHADRAMLRPIVLGLSTVAAVAVIVRTVM